MEKATQVLNLLTMVIVMIIGLYVHVTFYQILSELSLFFLWGTIAVLVGFQLEFVFNIVRHRLINL